MGVRCPKCQHENPDDTLFCGKCATRLPSPEKAEVTETLETPKEELARGTTLANRYEIIEELGKGGMGRVYRVEDTKLKQDIALKLIKPEIAKDKKTIERFRNELKLARNIRHKNVCGMFDLGEAEGAHFITMEFVPGEDLRSLIRRIGQLPIGKSISIATQICEGLSEAHRLGVVHRDLKSNNIMIDKEGNVRIMDFGIARSLEAKGITGAGVMIGTPEYMSPEQVEGKEVDQRSDIYSLGIILYEMVTGRVPFEGDTPFTIGVKHKSEMPQNPKELNTQISDDLNRVILRCLEKGKEERYQSAGEVRSELINIEKGIPTTERIAPERKPLTSKEITVTFGLKKLLIPALIVITVVVVGLIIWSPWTTKKISKPSLEKPSIAVLPLDDLSPQMDQKHLCDGIPESIIMALSRVENIRVPASTSSFSFRGKEGALKEIGEKLKVKTALAGSVQKAGNRVRIRVQLISIEDESLLWNEQYDRELDDIFAIQDEISLAIVGNLRVRLLEGDKEKILKRYTNSPEAYNLYLWGRHFWNLRTDEGVTRALEYFEKAVELDQNYALAYSGLADCYSLLPWVMGVWLPNEAYPKAREAALKALSIDDTLSEAHASLAVVKHWFDWDWLGAEDEFKRAVDLNPGYASAHQWYAYLLILLGREKDSIEEYEKAAELNPLSPIIITNLGDSYYRSRQYDKAMEHYSKALEINPEFTWALVGQGKIHLIRGTYEDAFDKFQRIEYPLVVAALMGLGKKDEAYKTLDEWEKRSEQENIDPNLLAMVHFGVGDKERVLNYLEKAIEDRYPMFQDLIIDPYFVDKLQTEARFKAIYRQLNLEQVLETIMNQNQKNRDDKK